MISGKKRQRRFETEAHRVRMRSERKKNEAIGHRGFRKLLHIWWGWRGGGGVSCSPPSSIDRWTVSQRQKWRSSSLQRGNVEWISLSLGRRFSSSSFFVFSSREEKLTVGLARACGSLQVCVVMVWQKIEKNFMSSPLEDLSLSKTLPPISSRLYSQHQRLLLPLYMLFVRYC